LEPLTEEEKKIATLPKTSLSSRQIDKAVQEALKELKEMKEDRYDD
jgi:hypothetical protein